MPPVGSWWERALWPSWSAKWLAGTEVRVVLLMINARITGS
jgi:hypothetical protein